MQLQYHVARTEGSFKLEKWIEMKLWLHISGFSLEFNETVGFSSLSQDFYGIGDEYWVE